MSEHECKEPDTCCCSLTALEPDEDCPVHGIEPWPPHCVFCGKFLPWPLRAYDDSMLESAIGQNAVTP